MGHPRFARIRAALRARRKPAQNPSEIPEKPTAADLTPSVGWLGGWARNTQARFDPTHQQSAGCQPRTQSGVGMSPPQSGAALSARHAVGRIMSRGGGRPFDRGILAIVSSIFPRSVVFAAQLCCFSTPFLPGLSMAGEPRSYAAKREFQQAHPCPSTGANQRRLPRLCQRSHRSARLPRPRYGGQLPMADCPGREG